MPALHEVQAAFRRAVIGGDDREILPLLEADGIGASERIAVYRNNVACALLDALRDTFPVICRLVDERFFAYAAHVFIERHPPERVCLAEYGARFPDFLVDFPSCRELVYLPDVARLEWLMNVAAHGEDVASVAASALGEVAPEEAPRLVFRLKPTLGLLASPWPIDRIWRANRSATEDAATLDLSSGGAHLEVSREEGEVVLRRLDAASFAFRAAIAGGATLGDAAKAAFAADERFDLGGALSALFTAGAIIAASIAPEVERPSR